MSYKCDINIGYDLSEVELNVGATLEDIFYLYLTDFNGNIIYMKQISKEYFEASMKEFEKE